MSENSQPAGETLAQRLERGPLAAEEALSILENVLISLVPLHADGRFHGGIIPDLISFTSDGEATLEGLPESKPDDPKTEKRDSTVLTQPEYKAPEQIYDDPVDARVDVFALGVITYEMLTGKNPFSTGEGASRATVIHRILYRPYPELAKGAVPGVTEEIRLAVTAAMSRDPKARFADARRFLKVLKGTSEAAEAAPVVFVSPPSASAEPTASPEPSANRATTPGASVTPGPPATPSPTPTSGLPETVGYGQELMDRLLFWRFEVRRNPAPYVVWGILVLAGLAAVVLVVMAQVRETPVSETLGVVSTSTSTTFEAVLVTDSTTTSTTLPETTTTLPVTTTSESTTTTVPGKLPAAITLSGLTRTYTGSAAQVSAKTDPEGLNVVIAYSRAAKPVDAPVNAGTYAVTATIDDAQYQGSVTGELTIRKANAVISVDGWRGTYDGYSHRASGSARGAKGENLGTLLTFTNSFVNVPGGSGRWTFAGNGNYNSASGSVAIVISKASASISVSGYNHAYDGKAHGATLNYAKGVRGENLNTLIVMGGQTYTDPGERPASWTFKGNGDYYGASGTVNIRITKADASIHVSGWTGEYDGYYHGASGSATGVLGESLGLDLGLNFKEIGEHTAHWSFAGNAYYNSASGNVTIKILEPPATTSSLAE